jgi:SAM-dependent methyltransferase
MLDAPHASGTSPVQATGVFARRATLRRSVRLLSGLRHEQREPERFYTALAKDTAALVDDLWRATHGEAAAGRVLLDVGGGPGYFASAFADVGVQYVAVEPDPSEMHAAPALDHGSGRFVRASGTALPFPDGCMDVALSSNVAEHVREPWQLGAELLRVTKPGGLALLSYTVWLSPFGGHEMGPTHYFGGARAARWYTRRHGHAPKNNYGSSLFAVSARDGLRWARSTGALVAAFPRYHPRWAWWVTSVPLLREFAVSNLVLVLQPSGAPD